ncbi:unnamed protein product [Caenorhabditis angaria]|uniref:Potassium channel domain-containing protein n=1 Tax=Caenorhabditis angaria TaxID=860376 RepID=A0A9P1IUB8_9PELO|nr:unnamed protein product [Caenorhabditis angaria]
MVFHTRSTKASKKKLDMAKFAPYALHLAMVVAVAVYVVGGAIAIRKIEASPVQVPDATAMMKKRNIYEEPIISFKRTQDCVKSAIEKIRNCTNGNLTLTHIDNCYKNDLVTIEKISEHRRAMQKQEEMATNITKSKGEIIDGYEYWTLMDSVLFCFTVITTIGYGNVAPKSFEGRLFVIFYGLVGVPFTMMAIANIGKFLATLLKTWTRPFLICCRRIKKRLVEKKTNEIKETQRLMEKSKKKAKKIEDDVSSNGEGDEDDEEVEESEETETFVLFFAFVVYIVIGSIVIAAYEPEMDFFEAIYFNFVTLTTIGLGDLVPQSDTYLAITLIYCAIGLALTTIAIEIAADTLKKLHYFGRKIDNVANVQVWFGGQKISMKALVKNLGDQFNVPVEELEKLNLGKFVDDAIKVEAGELTTLRNDRAWMNSNYWRAIESGSMHYVDDDDLVTLDSNLSSESRQLLLKLPHSSSRNSHTITILNEPLLEEENLDVAFASESSEAEAMPMPDFQIIDQPDTMTEAELRRASECRQMQQLLQAFKDYQNEINAQDGRWSEEARKRYLEYQRVWSKFRQFRNSPQQ